MKVAILSTNSRLYSTRRLVEAARARGHKVRVLNHLRCYMDITATRPAIHYGTRKFTRKSFDAIIPRIGASVTYYGTAVVRQFEVMDVFCLNQSQAILNSRDKLGCLQILAQNGIDLPNTAYAHSTEDIDGIIKRVGGAPLVIKLLQGTQGAGVVMAQTKKAAESVIQAFMNLKADILVQEFIAEAEGCDLRCLVIGDQVVASMQRQAAEGEFRSNLHLGATASAIELTDEERNVAIEATRLLGLEVAGVDIMRSKRGPVIVEVNSSPGLQGIEQATKVNVADKIIEYIERKKK